MALDRVADAGCSQDGNLVTRDELVDEVGGGRATSDEPINRCLSQLRGHLGDPSCEMPLAAVEIDPDSAVINSRVATVCTYLGNTEKAHQYFERAEALGITGPTHLQPYALLQALGIIDHWRQANCSWDGRKVNCPRG